jgi:hypothetical protein
MESEKSFGERLGISKPKLTQLNSLDADIRNDLYNHYYVYLYTPLSENKVDSYFKIIWAKYFKLPIDEFKSNFHINRDHIKALIQTYNWYQVYDFFEFLLGLDYKSVRQILDLNSFKKSLNAALVSNNSGYRLVNEIFVPITNNEEVFEINKLDQNTLMYALNEVRQHLDQSLKLISLKPEPDYRNSIKESISMVGTMARTFEPSNDLGKALYELEKNNHINKQLSKGFQALYQYTSGKDGIRHELMNEVTLDLETTRFFLIACSAFTNYLIEKGLKAGKLPSN